MLFRTTAAYLNGDRSFEAKIMQKRKDADAALELLNSADQELGAALSTGSMVSNIRDQWDNIKNKSLQMQPADAIGAHSKLVSDLLALLMHLADKSEITLDPELDTYYLGDALVNKLPLLTEAMGQSRAVGSGVAAKRHVGRARLPAATLPVDAHAGVEGTVRVHLAVAGEEADAHAVDSVVDPFVRPQVPVVAA